MTDKHRTHASTIWNCHVCQKMLDLPYVFQTCQHIVCSTCAHNHRFDSKCPGCAGTQSTTDDVYNSLGLCVGKCEQLVTIMKTHNRNNADAVKQLLRKNPTAYAKSTIQPQVLPFGIHNSGLPRYDATDSLPRLQDQQKKKKKKKKRSCMRWLCCWPCLLTYDVMCYSSGMFYFLTKRLVFVALFVAFFSLLINLSDMVIPGSMDRIIYYIDTHADEVGFFFTLFIAIYGVMEYTWYRLRNEN